MSKNYIILDEYIEEKVPRHPADGCIVSDMITVHGHKVGDMRRYKPANERDSGWIFMAGDEPKEFMNDMNNVSILHLNIVANYDSDIINLLDAKYYTGFKRNEKGELEEYYFPDPQTGLYTDSSQAEPQSTTPDTINVNLRFMDDDHMNERFIDVFIDVSELRMEVSTQVNINESYLGSDGKDSNGMTYEENSDGEILYFSSGARAVDFLKRYIEKTNENCFTLMKEKEGVYSEIYNKERDVEIEAQISKIDVDLKIENEDSISPEEEENYIIRLGRINPIRHYTDSETGEQVDDQFFEAVEYDDIEKIKQLASEGKNINSKSATGTTTALRMARMRGTPNAELIDCLLALGAKDE